MKLSLGLLVSFLLLAAAPARAVTIVDVVSPKGIHAWLIEDHKLPLIAFDFAFRGGVEQDPADKQGLASLSMALLTQGAGPYDAAAFQAALADHGVAMHFSAGRDELQGGLKTLSEEQGTAFTLLHAALTQPLLASDDIERARARQLTRLRFQMGDADWQARFALLHSIFKDHPYGQRSLGSIGSLSSLKPEDIKNFLSSHLARGNVVVAVAGDMTPDQLKVTLDQVFGDLPETAKLSEIPEVVWPQGGNSILVPREGTQTALLFAKEGPKRTDPDFYAAEIANYILGAGGFSSRLMQQVRVKSGLTYGIDTGLAPMEHASMLTGNAATDNLKAGSTWSMIEDVWRKFFHEGAKDDEVKAAKDYLTGSLPLTLTSTDAIAETLVEIQLEKLGIDYLDKRESLIAGVTDSDLKSTITKWFNPVDLDLVMVGEPKGLKAKVTEAQVRQ